MVSQLAAGDQVEGAPAQLLLRVAAGAVAAVEFLSRQVRLEGDAAWHGRVLPYLRLLCKTV